MKTTINFCEKNEFGYKLQKIYTDYKYKLKYGIGETEWISCGISELYSPSLYKKNCNIVHFESTYSNYSLISSIKIYEKLLASKNIFNHKYADYVTVTIGATNAIQLFFKYYSSRKKEKHVLFLGYQYYLFHECCHYYHIDCEELVSDCADRILPTVVEIKDEIEFYKPDLVVLTHPANPSGELYTEDEFMSIVGLFKDRNIDLLVDRCQADEYDENYCNIEKIIVGMNYYKNTTIINSYSKIRSMPGLRLGYIVGEQNLIDFVDDEIKFRCFMPTNMCIFSIVMDNYFRLCSIYQKMGMDNDIKAIEKMYKLALRNVFDPDYPVGADGIYTYFCQSDKNMLYNKFKLEVEEFWLVVKKNYDYVLKVLDNYIVEATVLRGGFNFIIKLKTTLINNEFDFGVMLYRLTGLKCMTQNYFSLATNNIFTDSISIRITLAIPCEIFQLRIQKLKAFLDQMVK